MTAAAKALAAVKNHVKALKLELAKKLKKLDLDCPKDFM